MQNQEVAFQAVKGYISGRKRWPFAMQKATFYKHGGQASASRWDTSCYIKRKSYGGTAHTFRRQACLAAGTPPAKGCKKNPV